jgi:hypothetical protein
MRLSGGNGVLLSARAACISAAQRVDDAGELNQDAVTGRLDDAAVMAGDFRIDHLDAKHLESGEVALLVGFDQARIASHVGGEDRCEPTFDTSWPRGLHGASSVADDPIPSRARRALSMRLPGREATVISASALRCQAARTMPFTLANPAPCPASRGT